MTTLFLFAHQDDELGVMHEIVASQERGEQPLFVYLTNGAWKGVASARRNDETRMVLGKLGVEDRDICFLGTEIGIGDGELVEHLERCRGALMNLAEQHDVRRIVMHAWEGGHQDHDAVHLLGVALGKELGLLTTSAQFPLYRMPAGRFRLTFAAPLVANGEVSATRIPISQRLRNLALLRHYRSQLRVMIKLAPHIAWDYLVDGRQKLQPVSVERVHQRPYPGQLLYEMWRLYTWDRFVGHAQPFVDRHLPIVASGELELRHD